MYNSNTNRLYIIFQLPDLTILHQVTDNHLLLNSSSLTFVKEHSAFFVGETLRRGAGLLHLNVDNYSLQRSPIVHTNEISEDAICPFAIVPKPDLSAVLFGTALRSRTEHKGSLWLWNRKEDASDDEKMIKIPIGEGTWKVIR